MQRIPRLRRQADAVPVDAPQRARLLAHHPLGLGEPLPLDDHHEREQDGVDHADDRDEESHDLVLVALAPTPASDAGSRLGGHDQPGEHDQQQDPRSHDGAAGGCGPCALRRSGPGVGSPRVRAGGSSAPGLEGARRRPRLPGSLRAASGIWHNGGRTRRWRPSHRCPAVSIAPPRRTPTRRSGEHHDRSSRSRPPTVAIKIKLMRLGKMRAPYYRIVVADARTKREGRVIETIGKYHPKEDPSFIEVDADRAAVLARRRRAADRARRRDPQGDRRLAEVQGRARPAAHAGRRAEAGQEGRLRGRRPRRWRQRGRHHAEEEGRAEEGRRRGSRRRRPAAEAPAPTPAEAADAAEAPPPRPLPRPPPTRPRPPRSGRDAPPSKTCSRTPSSTWSRASSTTPTTSTVDMVTGRRGKTLEVRVHPDDLGKVIGRNGRTAKALRTVMAASAARACGSTSSTPTRSAERTVAAPAAPARPRHRGGRPHRQAPGHPRSRSRSRCAPTTPTLRFAPGAVLLTDPAERGPLTVADARWHSGRAAQLAASRASTTATPPRPLRDTLLQVDARRPPASSRTRTSSTTTCWSA